VRSCERGFSAKCTAFATASPALLRPQLPHLGGGVAPKEIFSPDSRTVTRHDALAAARRLERDLFPMDTSMSIPPAEIRMKLRDKILFADFSDTELDEFIALCDVESHSPGELIVKQDDRGDCMYILFSGQGKVVHHKEGHRIDLAVLHPGDFFGEIALVDAGPRSADVIAIEPSVLLKITHAAISALAVVYPNAAFKFLIAIGRIMVNRLRKSNERYIDSLLFPIAGKD
jgi:hypothetical protein